MSRVASKQRQTKETSIEIDLNIDGTGVNDISTGVPFFDHMLSQLSKHGGFDLTLKAQGDLEIDSHHTVEDTGILLGECFRQALGEKRGVVRFADASVPLDEALINVALDLSGRPFLTYDVNPYAGGSTAKLGEPGFDPQLAEEFWRAFVMASMITMHVRMISGVNSHHIIEATFKSAARALRQAVKVEGDSVPSTKGTLNV